jgi:hypothetical protein
VIAVPPAMASVLGRGEFCHLAARTDRGPHLTPMVFVLSDASVWVTTSRGSVKARAWRSDPVIAGLVRDGDAAVSFVGRARPYDVLDPATWVDALGRSTAVAAASVRFSRKNARFFAGYAVDAHRVPLAWTPPARVFVEIQLRWAALLRGGAVVETAGSCEAAERGPASRTTFRPVRAADALRALPVNVRRAVGGHGEGTLALDDDGNPTVAPARWAASDGAILVSTPVDALARVTGGPSLRTALGIDRPSWWRARRMLGCMVQGPADVFVRSEVRSGRRALDEAVLQTGGDPRSDALVRLRPGRVVWWEGWTSGSARVA